MRRIYVIISIQEQQNVLQVFGGKEQGKKYT